MWCNIREHLLEFVPIEDGPTGSTCPRRARTNGLPAPSVARQGRRPAPGSIPHGPGRLLSPAAQDVLTQLDARCWV